MVNKNTCFGPVIFPCIPVERIKKIYHSLSKGEKRYIKNYLTAFHNKGQNKNLELIEILEKNPDITQAEMAERLYGDPKSKAFLMLKGRLIEKMLETLTLSINFHNNPTYKEDLAAYEAINLQKNMIYALVLRKRGLEEMAAEILHKCVKQAEENALPEFKLQALIYLRNISLSEEEVLWSIPQEIESSLAQYEIDVQAAGLFDEFKTRTRKQSMFDKETVEWLEKRTLKLEAELEKTYSVRAHYYYLTLMISKYEGEENYQKGRESLTELIDLVNRERGLMTKNRLGTPYLRLAGLEMLHYQFEAAAEAAEKAREIFHPHKFNYLSASLYKLFAVLYKGELELARETIESIGWFTRQKRRNTSLDIARYLESCLYFFQGDLKQASFTLGDVNELFSDKSGWNIGLRIYEIILLLEGMKYDLASARIETLRKHIAKYTPDSRTEAIFRYLYLLERFSFRFEEENEEMKEIRRKLKEEITWFAVGHEVVRFDSWIDSKIELKPFFPFFKARLQSLTIHI